MTQTVSPDPLYWDCPTIDTQEHIKAALGEPIQLPTYLDNGDWATDNPQLLTYLSHLNCGPIVEVERNNTYNTENNLSAEFIYTIFAPTDACDWCWASDIFVAIEVHQGGDVRGNYGDYQVYKVSNIAETGLFDIQAGWYCEPVGFHNPQDLELETINEHLEIGYSHWPTNVLRDYLAPNTEPAFNNTLQCWIGKLSDYPYPLKLIPTGPFYG